MSRSEERAMLLAVMYSSAGAWRTRNEWAAIDADSLAHNLARVRAAMDTGEPEERLKEMLAEHQDSSTRGEPGELLHWLLVNHPDLAAGFPGADYPDTFTPQERAHQVAPIRAALARRLNPAFEIPPSGLSKAESPTAPLPLAEYMSAQDLAATLELPPDATRKKLERLAKDRDCFIENESPRYGEAKRLYRVKDVLQELTTDARP